MIVQPQLSNTKKAIYETHNIKANQRSRLLKNQNEREREKERGATLIVDIKNKHVVKKKKFPITNTYQLVSFQRDKKRTQLNMKMCRGREKCIHD